jgi:hypothetical protein
VLCLGILGGRATTRGSCTTSCGANCSRVR